MVVLFDLRVTVSGPDDGSYLIHYELQECHPYPPRPHVEGITAGFADDVDTLDTASEEVPASLLVAPAIPAAMPDDLSPLWDRTGLEQLSHQIPQEMAVARARELLPHLFRGRGRKLLSRLWDLVPRPDTYSPWETPPAIGRITLEVESTALRGVAWEMGGWQEFGPRPWIMLRRAPEPAGEYSGGFDLPLTVAIDKCADAIRYTDGWGDRLFDGFTEQARHLGGIEWTERPTGDAPVEVHHLVYDSGSESSWGEMLSALESYDQDMGQVPPRLLVLHDISGQIPSHLTSPLVYAGLARGADAVLLASFHTDDPSAGGFFPLFYRKIMHNWPIDQSMLAALGEATQNHALPRGWALGARARGELGLLLTRAVVEKIQAVPIPKGRPSVSPVSPLRQQRVMAELQAQVQGAVQPLWQEMAAEIERAASISFDAETHGVYEVVQNRDQVREAIRAVERSVEAMGTLMSAESAQSPTVRMTNLWLTGDDTGQERPIAADEALVALRPYALYLQIGTRVVDALVAAAFPEELLREIFEVHEAVELDVLFFSPDADFRLEQQRDRLYLPRVGDSNKIRLIVTPQAAGQRRLRACIYYRNVLLQSVLLEATVVQEGAVLPDDAGIACTVDYVASTDLALLDELPQPTTSLFTNQAADGTHWIGVFGASEAASIQLRQGDMHTFGPGQLANRAERLRTLLAEIEGQKKKYKLEALPPLSSRDIEWREKDLVALAVEGWKLYDDLFLSQQGGLDMDRLMDLRTALQVPGLVSVARCRGDSTTIPWAALYDLSLDTNKEGEIKLCPIFKEQLAKNLWSDDGTELLAKHDLLDDPQGCRGQSQCPLDQRKQRKVTVCPFGFWGILHQVEQPLQQVKPTSVDEVPEELKNPGFNQTSFLMRAGYDKVRIAMGLYPGIPDAEDHREEISALYSSDQLEVVPERDRDEVLALLEEGGYHFYYFYCHGEVEGDEFKLKLGPLASPGYIASADLDPFEIQWSGQTQPLVVLNGCETMALTPELIHGFLGKLRLMGALGIVGTEIKVWTQLARPLGRTVLRQLFEGSSVGEAFLEVRKHLLRQYNPLGLVYTLHAPATLHLHDPADCDWCQKHLATGQGGGG